MFARLRSFGISAVPDSVKTVGGLCEDAIKAGCNDLLIKYVHMRYTAGAPTRATKENALAYGAIAARMIGGGFGGSVLALAQEDAAPRLVDAVTGGYREATPYVCASVDGAHEIELDGRRFWTWCAYDILGIFGALGASGRALSPSPVAGTIEVDFERGRPVNSEAVLFRPDEELMSRCENVYEEWCPNSNLFASKELAASWAAIHSMHGRVMQLAEAADLATNDWSEVV